MTVRLAACMALLAATAFVPAADAAGKPAKGQPVAGCNVSDAIDWAPVKGAPYRAEAHANGPGKCEDAAVTLVLRAPGGKALWVDARPATDVMTFASVSTRNAMQRALREWLTQEHDYKTTSDLPEWKEGADAPMSGEFPFYPDEGMDRDAYEEMRGEKSPVFCFVQGMESMECLALAKDGGISKIGLQLFPG